MTQHSEQSSYREKLLEHLLIAELLKISWLNGTFSLEVARPEVDRSGYDVILEANGHARYVQLKTTQAGSQTSKQKVHQQLGTKPSGCIVVVVFNEALALGPFLFFGGAPGEPLPNLANFKSAKHTKGNADGIKAVRPNVKEIPHSAFSKATTVEQLYQLLFGKVQLVLQPDVPASGRSAG